MVRRMLTLGCLIAAVAGMHDLRVADADDWPQWLGPNRSSEWKEDETISAFDDDGPTVKWRVPIAGGYAGPAVVDHRVYVMDYQVAEGDTSPEPDKRNQLQGTERVLCLDARTGETVWQHAYERPYQISYPAGPRVTPTVDGDVLYALGAEGDLWCLDRRTGTVKWSRNFAQDYQAKTPIWGYCGHPLVDGDKLICLVGGPGSLVVAFDKRTGKELWRSLEGDPGYSAPMITEAGGKRQLLIWHPEALSSLNPETGERYWWEPLDPNYGMSIVTPRRSGNLVFVGGIVNKSMMIELDDAKPSAQVKWIGNKEVGIDPVHSTPFAEGGFLYGVAKEGALCALRMDTGQRVWSHLRLMPDQKEVHSGTVFLVKNRDKFFLVTDSGELVIARLSPQGYKELGRAKILEPTGAAMGREVVWSHPAFADRCMFWRNDKEIVCVSLALRDN